MIIEFKSRAVNFRIVCELSTGGWLGALRTDRVGGPILPRKRVPEAGSQVGEDGGAEEVAAPQDVEGYVEGFGQVDSEARAGFDEVGPVLAAGVGGQVEVPVQEAVAGFVLGVEQPVAVERGELEGVDGGGEETARAIPPPSSRGRRRRHAAKGGGEPRTPGCRHRVPVRAAHLGTNAAEADFEWSIPRQVHRRTEVSLPPEESGLSRLPTVASGATRLCSLPTRTPPA